MSKGYYKVLNQESYNLIKSQLLNYRLDSFIREAEAREGKNKGLIFPFARGLRFSALLIYQIREILSSSDFEVNWGQIIDDEGNMCSGECDIIIHKKGHVRKWNGINDNNIMDFRFIHKDKAVVVISCKSYLTKRAIEVEYCENMLKFVKKVWLFAECCGPESTELIKNESNKIGYEHFWYFYKWNRNTGDYEDNFELWDNFITELKKL